MLTFGKWLLGIVVEKLLAFFQNLIADQKAREAERDAGRSEAVVEGQKTEDAALQGTRQAADEARARHRADPTDGAFKNTEFRD